MKPPRVLKAPLIWRLVVVGCLAAQALFVGSIALSFLDRSPGIAAIIAIVGVVLLLAAMRAVVVRVIVAPEGVMMIYLRRTLTVRAAEIAEVTVEPVAGRPSLTVVTVDDQHHRFPWLANPAADWEAARSLANEIESIVQAGSTA
jgi:hypothetical protein